MTRPHASRKCSALLAVARAGLLSAAAAAALGAAGCSAGHRTRDLAGERPTRRGEDGGAAAVSPTAVPAAPTATVANVTKASRARPVAHASARALALDALNLYYGDSDDDGVYVVPKAGGQPRRIARHAPVTGALTRQGEQNGSVVWVASPGDAVLEAPVSGTAQPTTLRDRGIFAGVAADREDVFIAEAIAAGGALLRVTGPTASRLASFDGAPRALMADATHVYVVTPTRLYRTTHERGELETLATGRGFAHAQLDDGFVYLVAEVAQERVVVRVPKAGGAMTVVARDVRDAPIRVESGELLFMDAAKPQIRAVPAGGGEHRVVADDDSLGTISALEADAADVFVATGASGSGLILAFPRR